MKSGLTLYKAHFQLTGRCNLACRFCGQAKGMLASSRRDELSTQEWLRCAEELKCAAERTGHKPEIMLWGGEPLLYPEFDLLARTLCSQGFSLGIVTNGTMLDQHSPVIAKCFENIFVSVDGGRAEHDAMRGAGVYDRVRAGVKSIRDRRGKLTLLCTVSDLNVDRLAELPESLLALEPDGIVLQPLIYLTGTEIEQYCNYSRENFQCDYPELTAWRRDDGRDYQEKLSAGLEQLAKRNFPVPVWFTPHCHPELPAPVQCRLPLHHVHIRHDGEVGFCTDFFGFSAGNVRKESLAEIFRNERAEAFRRAQKNGELPICSHCPWCRQEIENNINKFDLNNINNRKEKQKCHCLIG